MYLQVDVFDFSERKCMKCAAEVVTRVRGQPRARGALLVLPVGDALQEPFWPEGLGVNRGCHNALDTAWVRTLTLALSVTLTLSLTLTLTRWPTSGGRAARARRRSGSSCRRYGEIWGDVGRCREI